MGKGWPLSPVAFYELDGQGGGRVFLPSIEARKNLSLTPAICMEQDEGTRLSGPLFSEWNTGCEIMDKVFTTYYYSTLQVKELQIYLYYVVSRG